LLIIKNHSHHVTQCRHSDKPTAVTAPVLDSSEAVKPNNEKHSCAITISCCLDMSKDVAAPVFDSSNAVKQTRRLLQNVFSDSDTSDDACNRDHMILRRSYYVEKV